MKSEIQQATSIAFEANFCPSLSEKNPALNNIRGLRTHHQACKFPSPDLELLLSSTESLNQSVYLLTLGYLQSWNVVLIQPIIAQGGPKSCFSFFLVFIECFPSAKHYSKCFIWINSFNPATTLLRNYCFPRFFAYEKTEVEQLSNLLKMAQLIGGKAGIQTQVVWLQSLTLNH